jgi:hypothetical protein
LKTEYGWWYSILNIRNERRYEEAKELEKALITINNADYNH